MVELLTDYTTQIYHALSTDARPDADPGAQLREIDTGKRFIFDGSAWNELSDGGGGGGGGITLLASGEYVKASDSATINIPIAYSGTPVFWYYFNTTPKADSSQTYLGFTMALNDPDIDYTVLPAGDVIAASHRILRAGSTPIWSGTPLVVELQNGNNMYSNRPGASATHCAGTWKWRIYGRA